MIVSGWDDGKGRFRFFLVRREGEAEEMMVGEAEASRAGHAETLSSLYTSPLSTISPTVVRVHACSLLLSTVETERERKRESVLAGRPSGSGQPGSKRVTQLECCSTGLRGENRQLTDESV